MNPSSSSPPDAPPTTTDALRGLTRDRPGASAPLAELSRIDAGLPPGCETVGLPVRWTHRRTDDVPVAELAAEYDLLEIEHAWLGAAVAADCLMPLDDLLGTAPLARWRAGSVGPAFTAYEWGGRPWAVPYDVTAQMSAARTDLLRGEVLPATWDEVLASALPMTLCLGGPHALLTLCALSLGLGERPGEGAEFVSAGVGERALETMASLAARSDERLWRQRPDDVLAALAGADGPTYCPLVPGHAAATRCGPYPLTFGAAPTARPGGTRGSVFGGTGLAVSRRRAADPLIREALRDHLGRLLADPVQCGLFPVTGGQPAARAAWTDPRTDRRWGGFFRTTLDTVDGSWVRPRGVGFPAFQRAASELLRTALVERRPARRVVSDLNRLHRQRS
ncbi:extracellular solute-binding protein [Streptomyces sp. KL116D]|uniref:extracellular solute-binding protein n=1 Tax=Streptomyces sp. KL116D TaxID=3045152 RepID=UPI003556F7D2